MTRRLTRRRLSAALFCATCIVVACGETRRPIGEECLRNEDCLSSNCAARICAAEPTLVTGATGPAGEEEPRIPSDGSVSDAKAGGG